MLDHDARRLAEAVLHTNCGAENAPTAEAVILARALLSALSDLDDERKRQRAARRRNRR